jgi:hypothetical protein
MSEIQAGDGWRLLGPDETVKFADEYLSNATGCWHPMTKDLYGWKANCFIAVRRRIPAKPERLVLKELEASICHRKKKPETWKVVASIFTFPGTGYLDGDEARQLADWLTRYADWREAQESVAKTPPN